MRDSHILRALYGDVWAIVPEKLLLYSKIVDAHADRVLAALSAGESAEIKADKAQPYAITAHPGVDSEGDPIPYTAALQAASASSGAAGDIRLAVLPIHGTIHHRMTGMSAMSGGCSCEKFGHWFDQAVNDPEVDGVLLDVDSPGGSVSGVPELAAKIMGARGRKPMLAFANVTAGSAAYYLASAADELVVSPSGEVGSIGVWAMHRDISQAQEKIGIKVTLISAGKYKVEGHPFAPLEDEAAAAIQADVDAFYADFVDAVAKHRGATKKAVREGFGEGRMILARRAVEEGMADGVETFEGAVTRLAKAVRRVRRDRTRQEQHEAADRRMAEIIGQ